MFHGTTLLQGMDVISDVHARVVNPYHCRDSRLGAWRASRHNFMKLHRVDAGKVELDGAQYLGLNLPFSISQLLWIEVLLVGGAEIYRNSSTDVEDRIYPGALLDLPLPLPLARLGAMGGVGAMGSPGRLSCHPVEALQES